MKQSAELTKFYKDYIKWVEDGAPEENWYGFCRELGLCNNTLEHGELLNELGEQLYNSGLDTSYPFNKDDYDYRMEKDKTKNPLRIQWVRNHIVNE